MALEPGCPRCRARPSPPSGPSGPWVCPTHDEVTPLWRAGTPSYEDFARHLARAAPLPSWMPWPLPPAWQVTDFGCVGGEDGPPQASFVSCSGPTDPDGVVELTVVTEEPGVGLGARCAGVTHTDPGREAGVGPPQARVRLDGAGVPLWVVSTAEGRETLDRAALAGEAQGRWLWLVLRPASAVLVLGGLGALTDVGALGPQLLTVPFGELPRSW